MRRSSEQIQEDVRLGSKVCTTCKERKGFSKFTRVPALVDGYNHKCRECYNKSRRSKPTPNSTRTKEEVQYDITRRTKVCSKCGERKPFNKFGRHRHGADGYDTHCYKCKSKRERKYMPHRRYGISREAYDSMKAVPCEACGTMENLCIDHCHTTEKVRGTLCSNCNTALGLLNEDTERMDKLKEYITKGETRWQDLTLSSMLV